MRLIDGVNQGLEHEQGIARLDVPRKKKEVLKRIVGVILAIVGALLLYAVCHGEETGRIIYWIATGQGI
jgi:hypothetical protein